jgi:hypothetical protein
MILGVMIGRVIRHLPEMAKLLLPSTLSGSEKLKASRT